MASWQDRAGKVRINGKLCIAASFRAIPFFVESTNRSGGRRAPAHVFPFKDDVYKEDLGRKSRKFSLVGYVVGPDYLTQKKQLIEALEDIAGPGDLRHPYDGKRKCVCDSFEVTETTAEGGWCKFSIDFEETKSTGIFPSEGFDKIASVAAKVKTVTAALREAAANVDDFGRVSGDFLIPAEELIQAAVDAVNAPFSAMLQTAEDLADIRNRLDRMVDNIGNIVTGPLATLDALLEALNFAFRPPELPGWIENILDAYDGFSLGLLPASPVQTPRRTEAEELFNLHIKNVKTVMAIKAAEAATYAEFRLHLDAVTGRDKIVEKLDELIADADDELFQALEDLKVDLLKAVPGDNLALSERRNVTPILTTNSLVLTHSIFGSVDREQSLIDTNAITFPAFIVGGSPVEYMSDATNSAG